MRRIILALALISVALPASAAEWRTYVNDRFGTRIDIPEDVFQPREQSDNGDGQSFVSADGRASIRVFAGHNADGLGIDELYSTALDDVDGTRITYRKKGRSWFVLSGFKGDEVYYVKLLMAPDGSVAHTLEIIYPAADKPIYDPLTARVANSLSDG
ncbi:hypothetical protein [Chthonobacter albigriseus]|uniref:hypothetical protein n=1 Tax=Chthonobacter albigriseus TaxID=1683161 RepID=UPI0015EE79EF|nr:hypothetical protein [Chthonobacter albigriseus]